MECVFVLLRLYNQGSQDCKVQLLSMQAWDSTLHVEEGHLLKVLYAESSNMWGKRAVYVLKQLTVQQSS